MGTAPHILLVDDDDEILSLLTNFFRKHLHQVTSATNARQMWAALATASIDLVILDVMLKHEDGFSLCRQMRARSAIPIIMLTAMANPTDVVVGLELGADHYVTKPFDQRELLARVRAVLRRSANTRARSAHAEQWPVVVFAGWRLDITRRELRSAAGALIVLSNSEFELLLVLVEHPLTVLSREQLLQFIQDEDRTADRRIDLQVSRLRAKLEHDPKSPQIIRTVRHEGYMFAVPVTRK